MSETILYICDRKQCENCGDSCYLTTHIEHAKNFKRAGIDYYQEIEDAEKTIEVLEEDC